MSQKDKILQTLSDMCWHSTVELHEIAWRYGARIHELKKQGYVFNKKPHPTKKAIELWKLIKTPKIDVPKVKVNTQKPLFDVNNL